MSPLQMDVEMAVSPLQEGVEMADVKMADLPTVLGSRSRVHVYVGGSSTATQQDWISYNPS